MGLAVAQSQQPTQSSLTRQDNVVLGELSQTVTGLAEQVNQLTGIVQGGVLRRMTNLETELMGESNA
jgi:hypothetical protein